MSPFPDFETEYGPPELCLPVSVDAIGAYEGRLPGDLLTQWRDVGWCSYGKGLLWLVDPMQFSGVIADWVDLGDATPLVFLRTAFAHLYFWLDGSVYSLDVQRGGVSEVTKRISRMFTLLCDPEIKEKILRVSLFETALRTVGAPGREECYAFEPALALGGPGTADTIRRVRIREHLGILAQLVR
jgi:hypothetical protein